MTNSQGSAGARIFLECLGLTFRERPRLDPGLRLTFWEGQLQQQLWALKKLELNLARACLFRAQPITTIIAIYQFSLGIWNHRINFFTRTDILSNKCFLTFDYFVRSNQIDRMWEKYLIIQIFATIRIGTYLYIYFAFKLVPLNIYFLKSQS